MFNKRFGNKDFWLIYYKFFSFNFLFELHPKNRTPAIQFPKINT